MIWQLETLLSEKQISTPLPPYTQKLSIESIIRSGFTLHYPEGNTSFATKGTALPVAGICVGTENDIAHGKETVFIDDNDKIKATGIKKYIIGNTSTSGTPIFVCDNHNIVLEAWQLLKAERPTIIHIDQHRDNAIACQLESIHYTRICDYIDFAIKNNLIKKDIISIIESGDLPKVNNIPATNKICNIDIDIFAPECTVLTDKEKIDVIYKAAAGCSLITIATSPGFIDQQRAINIAKLLWQYL